MRACVCSTEIVCIAWFDTCFGAANHVSLWTKLNLLVLPIPRKLVPRGQAKHPPWRDDRHDRDRAEALDRLPPQGVGGKSIREEQGGQSPAGKQVAVVEVAAADVVVVVELVAVQDHAQNSISFSSFTLAVRDEWREAIGSAIERPADRHLVHRPRADVGRPRGEAPARGHREVQHRLQGVQVSGFETSLCPSTPGRLVIQCNNLS